MGLRKGKEAAGASRSTAMMMYFVDSDLTMSGKIENVGGGRESALLRVAPGFERVVVGNCICSGALPDPFSLSRTFRTLAGNVGMSNFVNLVPVGCGKRAVLILSNEAVVE